MLAMSVGRKGIVKLLQSVDKPWLSGISSTLDIMESSALLIHAPSSGDSNGSSVDQQKSSYTQLSQRRPNTVLTLNHETHGEFPISYASVVT